jgi:hypothetical protein
MLTHQCNQHHTQPEASKMSPIDESFPLFQTFQAFVMNNIIAAIKMETDQRTRQKPAVASDASN